jgi:hypothetical protein
MRGVVESRPTRAGGRLYHFWGKRELRPAGAFRPGALDRLVRRPIQMKALVEFGKAVGPVGVGF